MTGQKKHGGWGEKNTWFEKGCVSLAFFLSAVLILLFGIRIAGNTIQVAQAEKIEIINNLVEGLSESSKIKSQSKKVQSVVYKYLEAYIRAIAGFEFVPRNDFTVLTQILNSIPEETDVLSFVYHGRNLTIRTTQPQQECVLEMVEHLEQRAENDGEFSNVVYSYYLDGEGQYIAEITLVAHHYDEQNLSEELEKFLPKTQQSQTS